MLFGSELIQSWFFGEILRTCSFMPGAYLVLHQLESAPRRPGPTHTVNLAQYHNYPSQVKLHVDQDFNSMIMHEGVYPISYFTSNTCVAQSS